MQIASQNIFKTLLSFCIQSHIACQTYYQVFFRDEQSQIKESGGNQKVLRSKF